MANENMNNNLEFSGEGIEEQQEGCNGEEGNRERDMEQLKLDLRFNFSDPCKKYTMKECHLGSKLLLQVTKIILVIVQIWYYGDERAVDIRFQKENALTFRHIFLKGLSETYEDTTSPLHGAFALYEKQEFYNSMDHILKQAYIFENITIGAYALKKYWNSSEPDIRMCTTQYRNTTVDPRAMTFTFDRHVVYECFRLRALERFNKQTRAIEYVFDTNTYLMEKGMLLDFNRLLAIDVRLNAKTVYIKAPSISDEPYCVEFAISILYDLSGRIGIVPVDLNLTAAYMSCLNGTVLGSLQDDDKRGQYVYIDVLIILSAFLSIALCTHSLIQDKRLQQRAEAFFTLTKDDKKKFFRAIFILIILSDVMILSGSIVKILIDYRMLFEHEKAAILLGTGVLLALTGLLRYIVWYPRAGVLVHTMMNALPNIICYLVCAGVLFVSFMFCGWLTLGPYNPKFQTLDVSAETLFSLLNGDDIFATFATVDKRFGYAIFIYSRVYLYVFIVTFIYLVSNLFTAIILDAYETIKNQESEGSTANTELERFIGQLHRCNVRDLKNLGVLGSCSNCKSRGDTSESSQQQSAAPENPSSNC